MSDQNLEQHLANLGSETQQPTVETQPVAAEPVQPVTPPKVDVTMVQTPDKTLASQIAEPVSQSIGKFTMDEKTPYIRGFIGMTKTSYARVNDELELWQEYIGAKNMDGLSDKEKEKQGVEQSQIQAAITSWEDYVAEHYSSMSVDEVNERQMRVYSFINNIADALMIQYPVVSEQGLTNVMDRATNFKTPDINGLVPNKERRNFSLSEFMRRTSLSSGNEPYQYDLLLRNSYVAFRHVKPTRLDVGELISDIAKAVRGHVRTISVNLPALSNVAVMRVIWKFIRGRILHTSMKDVSDYDELADVIRITDINTIALSLLAQAYPTGVNFDLRCLAKENCDWSAQDIIDPTTLGIARKWLDTPEESAAYANMFNFSRKYSREESLKFIKDTNYQHEIEPVYNNNQSTRLVIGVPSLTESFEAEEFFSNLVNVKLEEIRQNSMTEEQYNTTRDDFLNGLVGTDYLHYISEYHILPAPGTDGEIIKIKRSESDPAEFNQGILHIIQDNDELATALVSAVIKHYPFMSKTFIGMANYHCEKCKGESEAYQDLGYTPINIISTFFYLVSLKYTGRSKVGENVRQEALLDVFK